MGLTPRLVVLEVLVGSGLTPGPQPVACHDEIVGRRRSARSCSQAQPVVDEGQDLPEQRAIDGIGANDRFESEPMGEREKRCRQPIRVE